jgi:hypothetical protein
VLLLAPALAACGGQAEGPPGASEPAVLQDASPPPSSSSLPRFGGTATVSAAPEAGTTVRLRRAQIGRHAGFDRLVFQFHGGLPGYRVGYVQPPIVAGASGRPLRVAGRAFLELRLDPATSAGFAGEKRIEGAPAGARMVRELVRSEDFEAVLTWVAGVGAREPFRVFTLRSPARIVVDLRTT